MKEPKKINAGDSRKWSVCMASYPATDWVLAYSIVNATTKLTIEGAAVVTNEERFDVTITSPVTASWAPGNYRLIGYMSNGDERHTIYDEPLRIDPDVTSMADRRSWAEKTLEAVEAVIANKATSDQSSVSFEGRSLARYTHTELILFRDRLKREVKRNKLKRTTEKTTVQTVLR